MKPKKHAGGRPVTKLFKLRTHDRAKLEKIIEKKSLHDARTYQRALILLRLSKGDPVTEIAEDLEVSRNTVMLRRELYMAEGLERTLKDGERSGRKATIGPEVEQQVVAIACTEPPPGTSHWTLRLLAEEVVKRKIMPSIGTTAIHVILQRHELKPWREKNVVRRKAR